MEIHRADSLLFSCSLDFTIKVWRLDTYELVTFSTYLLDVTGITY